MPAQEITVLWGGVGHLPTADLLGNNPMLYCVCCLLAQPTFTRYLY